MMCAPLDGKPILPDDRTLMEVKARGALPLWLAAALSSLSIYPVSFSKYGHYYQEVLSREATDKRRQVYVA